MDTINRIVSNPDIWNDITDDHASPVIVLQIPGLMWVLVKEEENICGAYLLEFRNCRCYEVHTCILPEYRGKKAIEIGKQGLEWIFNNTPCLKIITHVPECNPKAFVYARKCGFKQEGINRRSFMKYGILQDQYVLGICKEKE